ncbi:hypothetical protein [Polyangium sp. 15x6]|uniref:hypothetical protein n=1 Tax=Polyangium sp. 15x6 TaxID=3042687 RepID=UPI00249A4F88|nr:hypothetical protein [Polyangium sp. 15x6]MDI3292190.1 hypothetical protein [Polyangium sp. 15x6]
MGKVLKVGRAFRILRSAGNLKKKNVETLVRYVSEEEVNETLKAQALITRKGHRGPKRVAEAGSKIDPKQLGTRKAYSHKIELKVPHGTTQWLRQWPIEGEPRRYAIPEEELENFNNRILEMLITKVR